MILSLEVPPTTEEKYAHFGAIGLAMLSKATRG